MNPIDLKWETFKSKRDTSSQKIKQNYNFPVGNLVATLSWWMEKNALCNDN